ncbi:MAG: NADP-dependent malic enzyme [Acholeplasmataceae bacterium]|nr:NADP-dependent malic enzyme [Acidaminococcaceae bacterium]NLY83916.1 NADP-dependent malic enzyme [Acholeplasmataceae bacterium]
MTINEEALKVRLDHNGLLTTACKVPLKDRHDLSVLYTPGVAEPCKIIKEDKDLSFEYTCRGNMVAIVSDGTRVLGLGDIGPEAGLPVMEGKAVLFKTFADVDALPICLDTKDPDKIVETVRILQPSFAAINLEDISSPKCYDIEDRLKEICDIPIFHDDQHGTAIALCSAVIGALRFVKKDIKTVRIVVNGCGAAGSAIGRLLVNMGAENVIMVDRFGALYDGIEASLDRVQAYLQKVTNKAKVRGNLADVVKGADVLIGVSAPGVFTKEIIASMNTDAIVFGMANPVPETTYDAAIEAGAKVAGTGRSDAPNQVNNVTVFPGVFRGAMDVRAKAITEEMKIAAVMAIADLIEEKDLRADYVVPDAFDPRVAPAVAAAVAKVAIESGVARINIDPEVVRANTMKRVGR